jgi:hypothetical protein
VEVSPGLEAQVLVSSRKRDFAESSYPGDTDLLYDKVLCSKINSLMMRSYWGHKEKEKRIHLMSWSKMGVSKTHGGMGFRDFTYFNQALLAKQVWCLWKSPDSLVAKIMKAKYYPDYSALEAPLGKKPSFAWRSIKGTCNVVWEGLIWRVGNGEKFSHLER